MKILILNPFIDSSHEISTALKGLGAAILLPANADEAMKMVRLHGSSLDLAILHRESQNAGTSTMGASDINADLNLWFISKLRADPSQVDLPVVVTSSIWKDPEFVKHQEGTYGANAYLSWPVSPATLVQTINTMFGGSAPWAGEASEAKSLAASSAPRYKTPPPPPADAASAILESSSGTPLDNIVLEESRTNIPMPVREAASRSGISLVFNASDVGTTGESLVNTKKPTASPVISGDALQSLGPPPSSATPPPPPIGTNTQMENDNLEPHERLMLAANAAKMQAEALVLAQAQAVAPPVENRTELIQLEPSPDSIDLVGADAPPAVLSVEGQEPVVAQELSLAAMLVPPPAPGEQLEEVSEAPSSLSSQASLPTSFGGGPSPSDEELSENLPYLFGRKNAGFNRAELAESIVNQVMMFAEPVGDAVVPGGAASSPDMETMKKYLLLREQDVAVLSNQLKSAREQIAAFDRMLKESNGQILELKHVVGEQQRRIDEADQGTERLFEGLQQENEELKFQAKVKNDKVKVMEVQVRQATEEVEHLKERVRMDIRKIRVREKELGNKLEIMRRDSEVLIAARENKIIELKRKVDLLEFNLDLLQDQYSREKEATAQLRERLGKAAQVVRVAEGLLDSSSEAGDKAGSSSASSTSGSNRREESPRASGIRETA